MKKNIAQNGFTLIELLLVIAIISILVATSYALMNPLSQLAKARNAERHVEVQTILNAIYQYSVDQNRLPPGIPLDTPKEVCVMNAPSCNNGVDLDALIGLYSVEIPGDPQATGTGTDYLIMQDSNGRLTVSAPFAEKDEVISITR